MPSIKVLNISLVLLCIFITAFVCTFLAITSSDKALDDTKESRDVSVGAAFSVGEESVTNRTTEYMDLVLGGTVGFLGQFTQQHRMAAAAIASELMSETWDTIKRWEYHHLPRHFHTFDELRSVGSTNIALILTNRLTIIHSESETTVGRAPDAYHSLLINYNHGDDHPWGGYGRTIRASADSRGYPVGVTDPTTDIDWTIPLHGCLLATASNGTVPDLACNSTAWLDPPKHPIVSLGKLTPPGSTVWTPPLPIDTWFLALYATAPLYHNGTYTGSIAAGVDLRRFSTYLSALEIGGPVEGHPSRGRVYITLRSTWLSIMAQGGELLGASHGSVMGRNAQDVPYALQPQQSSDDIISSVTNRTTDLDLDALVFSRNLTVINIPTDLAPRGEDFYYRVGHVHNDHGIDWYVHLVIDREYILGSIDKKTAETRDEVRASEQKVDDDLREARATLYVIVATVALALTLLSVVLVLRIIEPLLVLEKEMAAVAVMHLEAVDTSRPLSALGEVRLMQVSFLQMIRNLVEYRNYMPASVLHTDEDDESVLGDTSNEMSVSMSMTRTSGSSGPTHSTWTKGHGQLPTADVRIKRVTLMACNMVGFLQTQDAHNVQAAISRYLAAGLHHLKASKGIPDSFSGDRLYASWNGVRVCASHRTAAYLCARELCADKGITAKLSIGLASGEAKCGNMGCEGMKKYSYIGSLSSWVHVVERIGRSMECDVAIDAVVNEEVCNKAYTRMLQHVEFAKHSSRVLRVYEAMQQKEVAAEEWMYQLREGDTNDPNKAYNASYELFMEKKVPEAVKAVERYDDGTKAVQLYKARLQEALKNRVLCEPLGRSVPLYY